MKTTSQLLPGKHKHSLWGPRSAVIAAILISIICFMIWNTSGLKKALDTSTEEYVLDVTNQLTGEISAHIESLKTTLTLLSKSVPFLPDDSSLEEFLEDTTELLNYDQLAVICRDGTALPGTFDLQKLHDISGIRNSFNGEFSVVYTEGQNLLFQSRSMKAIKSIGF